MINKKIMSAAVKYFKENKIISSALLMRKFKIDCDLAIEICKIIEKRFPNLWREGRKI
jgi:hypothetical protein